MGFINLFSVPNINVWVRGIKHNLHDSIVGEFESRFCEYVGAKYGVALNSASNAIILALLGKDTTINIPSMLPPVVANSVINSGNTICFQDDIGWVGYYYILYEKYHDLHNDVLEDRIIDSAQYVGPLAYKYAKEYHEDLMIFSFYPTKPIGGCDGGIIVSNNMEKIEKIRRLAYNGGTTSNGASWDQTPTSIGWKFYMSSFQAYIANKSMDKINRKLIRLEEIEDMYTYRLTGAGWVRASCAKKPRTHLFRINITERNGFIKYMREKGVQCGIHYRPLHHNKIYKSTHCGELSDTDREGETTISIPFHEKLSNRQVKYIIHCIKGWVKS